MIFERNGGQVGREGGKIRTRGRGKSEWTEGG